MLILRASGEVISIYAISLACMSVGTKNEINRKKLNTNDFIVMSSCWEKGK